MPLKPLRPTRIDAPRRSFADRRARALACVPLWLACAAAGVAGPDKVKTRLNRFETQHYVIHTDLGADAVREAAVRIDRMAEEYANRTRGFRGRITKKLPFYLYTRAEDYFAAGGLPGSAGTFMGDALVAIAGEEVRAGNWNIVQHEGFHQYVDAVIKGDIPTWINEGLAEYFGEALFTGQGYVSGIIPQHRLERIKKHIEAGAFKPLLEMMLLGQEKWNETLKDENYDQAWSMVQFLAHGEDGKYQERFIAFAREAGRGIQWERAWMQHFGAQVNDFEARWREYWKGLPDDPTRPLYVEADVAVLTAFLARAAGQKQRFDSAEAFNEEAAAGALKAHAQDWLPSGLLAGALDRAGNHGAWTLEGKKGAPPSLVCVDEAGTRFTGRFTLRGERVSQVTVEVVKKGEGAASRPARGARGK